MSQAPSVAFAGSTDDHHVEPANVSLKGTTRGLEILIAGTPSAGALGARLTELLAEAPGFFAGSNARVAIDGVLPIGALACLEDVATRFELRIVEIGPVAARRPRDLAPVPHAASPLSPPTATPLPPMPPIPPLPAALPAGTDDVPLAKLAEGTGPIAEDAEINPSGRVRLSGDAGASDQVSSPALVSAATALVNAALAMTSEPSGAALAPWTPADSPTGAAARIALTESSTGATANAALTHSSNGAAANAALTDSSIDAAAKAASTDSSTGTTTTAAPTDAPSDAACKAAPVATREPGSASDPGLLAALAAVLVAAGGGDAAAAPADESPPGPRLVFGPLRSGRIVDHVGHLIVIGDVNPGAEVRAEGSIIVLGRLRGVAHAAIGRDAGCIIALSLQPQQLRIGRMVARAGDADRPGGGAEIAYATGETIVVERFSGRLPSGLAASM
jgi:septum formation inhibitor MinC